MKEEEGRQNAAVDAFNLAEKRIAEMKNKMANVEKDKKSAKAALDNAQRQAEGQRVLLCQAEDQLAASKEQITAFKKKLEKAKTAREEAEKAWEEAEKAREEAQQEGYDIGVAETEEALRAKVSGVCRNYFLQVWNEALNQSGVEASSIFRKAERVYFPPTIGAASSSSSKVATLQKWPNILG